MTDKQRAGRGSRLSVTTINRYYRQPSQPPITEPTIRPLIVATRSSAPGSLIKRVKPSIESVSAGGVTLASCQRRSTDESSSVRTDRITTSGDISFADLRLYPSNDAPIAKGRFDLDLREARFTEHRGDFAPGVLLALGP
jgi:hypothetical protein